jgi:hypothetical protein
LNSDPALVSSEQRNTQQRIQQRINPSSSSGIASQSMSSASVLYPKADAYPPQHLGAGSSGKPRLAATHLPDRAMMGAQPPPATQRSRPNSNSSRPSPYSAHVGESRSFPFCLSHCDADPEAAIQYQAPGSHLGLVPANSNTAYSAAQPAAHPVAGGSESWLPQDPNFPLHQCHPQGYNNAYLVQQGVYQQWQERVHASQEHLLVPQPAHTRGNTAVQTHPSPLRRSRSKGQVTPDIRVTTTERPYTPDSQVQPQDSHHTSATSLYAPYEFAPPVYFEDPIPYSQQPNPEMADIQVQPQVIGPSNGGIASPISDHPDLSRPISPAPMTDPNLRKRSFSEMSQGPPHMQMVPTDQQSPQGVAYETSPNGIEDAGHKVQRMIKRGDPPQAHDGKYYCNFAPECADQYFDRKCEWR